VTCAEWLRRYTSIFQKAGIDQAAEEAIVLLCHTLCGDKAAVLSQPERTLTGIEISVLEGMAERRLRREPAAYIAGEKEFFGLSFFVDSRVLIPRPETETLVEAAIEFHRKWVANNRRRMLVADIGTGCGNIAVALAVHLPETRLYAVDSSLAALEVATANIRRHRLGERITVIHGNLLEQINQGMDLIVANLPYIPRSDLFGLQPEIRLYEPVSALDGGESGTELVEALIEQAVGKLAGGGAMFLEIGQDQGIGLKQLACRALPSADVTFIKDLSGIDRCMAILLPA